MTYRVLVKHLSPLGEPKLQEEIIAADDVEIVEGGIVVFSHYSSVVRVIPPGLWFGVTADDTKEIR